MTGHLQVAHRELTFACSLSGSRPFLDPIKLLHMQHQFPPPNTYPMLYAMMLQEDIAKIQGSIPRQGKAPKRYTDLDASLQHTAPSAKRAAVGMPQRQEQMGGGRSGGGNSPPAAAGPGLGPPSPIAVAGPPLTAQGLQPAQLLQPAQGQMYLPFMMPPASIPLAVTQPALHFNGAHLQPTQLAYMPYHGRSGTAVQ
jgi:hypothetical protein